MNAYRKGSLAALLLVAAAAPAMAQDVEFTLINNSSYSLHYFYTTPSDENSWGEDLLGETGTLEAGYQGTVFIGDGSDQCIYDFRFETGEGHVLEVAEVDICSLDSYTLTD